MRDVDTQILQAVWARSCDGTCAGADEGGGQRQQGEALERPAHRTAAVRDQHRQRVCWRRPTYTDVWQVNSISWQCRRCSRQRRPHAFKAAQGLQDLVIVGRMHRHLAPRFQQH